MPLTMPVKNQQSCKRCGKCCEEGGPALHGNDLELIGEGKIPLEHLVTIRKGEISRTPGGAVNVVSEEFVKLSGVPRSWSCRYYKKESGCGIYSFRPLACHVLQCWNTAAIERLIGKDLLNRRAILKDLHPMLEIIEEHEQNFSCTFLVEVLQQKKNVAAERKNEIELLVQKDLRFRDKIVQKQGISLGEELFFFGRPLFQLLQPLGVSPVQRGNALELRW